METVTRIEVDVDALKALIATALNGSVYLSQVKVGNVTPLREGDPVTVEKYAIFVEHIGVPLGECPV